MTPTDHFRYSIGRLPSGQVYAKTAQAMRRTDEGLCPACAGPMDGEPTCDCEKEEA